MTSRERAEDLMQDFTADVEPHVWDRLENDIVAAIDEAVREADERAAKIAEDYASDYPLMAGGVAGRDIAAAIRRRTP